MEQLKNKGESHAQVAQQFEIRLEGAKSPSILDELLALLKRLLHYCACALTCGCIPPPESSSGATTPSEYGTDLLDTEKQAVENLLSYLESGEGGDACLRQHLQALAVLTYSDNPELQRSASLCLLDVSEKGRWRLTDELCVLLKELLCSPSPHVHRVATLALANFTSDPSIEENRDVIVSNGLLPDMVDILSTNDEEVLYYTSAALGNIAVNERYNVQMVAIGNHDLISHMIRLLYSNSVKVQWQACLLVRNIASNLDQQVLLVRLGVLEPLHKLLQSSPAPHITTAALACLRNLSIAKANELSIVSEDFLPALCNVLVSNDNCGEAQCHAAGTIRNIAVGDHIQAVIESECVDSLCTCLINVKTQSEVHADVTAALAVLAEEDEVKEKLLSLWKGKVFSRLVSLASLSTLSQIQYNTGSIIAQLVLHGVPGTLKANNKDGIVLYIDKFVKSKDSSFVHLGLWTLSQLLSDESFVTAFQEHMMSRVVSVILVSSHPPAVLDLAQTVLDTLGGGEEDST